MEQASFFVNTVRPHGVQPGDMFAIAAKGRPGITSAVIQACCVLVGPRCPVLVHADSFMARLLTTCIGFPLWIACEGPPTADVLPWDAWRFWQCSVRPASRQAYDRTAEDLDTWIRGYTSVAPSPPIASQRSASWQEQMMKSLHTLDIGARDTPDAWRSPRTKGS
jgi:hypothetical protein